MDSELISVTEAASVMSLGRSQVLRLCNCGRLPGAQKVGNTWVIPRSSVETYKPGPQGFAAVWEQRRAEKAAKRADDAALIEAALKEARVGAKEQPEKGEDA